MASKIEDGRQRLQREQELIARLRTANVRFSAVLFHTLIVRDRLLDRMAIWRIRSRKTKSQS